MRLQNVYAVAVAALLGQSAASQLQINWYSDRSCTAYGGNTQVTWADQMGSYGTNCFNFHYGTSVNIANCYESFCMCEWYYNANCQGDYTSLIANSAADGNCIRDSGNFNSFRCYEY